MNSFHYNRLPQPALCGAHISRVAYKHFLIARVLELVSHFALLNVCIVIFNCRTMVVESYSVQVHVMAL